MKHFFLIFLTLVLTCVSRGGVFSDTVAIGMDNSDTGLAISAHDTIDTSVAEEKPPDLRTQLERVYLKVYSAVTHGDVPTYLDYTSQESKNRIRAVLDPLGRTIDAVLLGGMESYYKDLQDLAFVRIYKNAGLAALLYVADSDMVGLDEKPRVTFTFIKFLLERDGWKMEAMIHVGSLKYHEDGITPMDLDLKDVPFWQAGADDAADTSLKTENQSIPAEKKEKPTEKKIRSRSHGRKKDF